MAHAHIPDHPAVTQTVLATLAHLGCATLSQIHALCFPQAFASTVRLALMGLLEAGLITHSHWRLNSGDRSQVWTITPKGLAQLRRDLPHIINAPTPDLNRPSTPREKEEWRVRIEVRTLLVRLILEARQQPMCAGASLSASLLYPVPLTPDMPPQADAQIAIAWEPPMQQAADWLPWIAPMPPEVPMMRYAVYVERSDHPITLERWVDQCATTGPDHLPLVILASADCSETLTAQLQGYPPEALRWCSGDDLAAGWLRAPWRDAQGRYCSLRDVRRIESAGASQHFESGAQTRSSF